MNSAALELAQQPIRLGSMTPQDAGKLDALKSIYRQVRERLLLPA